MDGFEGSGLVNTFYDGDASTGVLTSPPFLIEKDYLCFLLGGGNRPGETGVELLIDSQVVLSATGKDTESLSWTHWQVDAYQGQTARVRIVDRATGGWGHINVDHIVQADSPAQTGSVGALWVDYGKDYYAAVSWSDVPESDGRRLWLGWMSNWTYAQDVPTAPWRSAMSIPREVGLKRFADGVRLVQTPVVELEGLRARAFQLTESATVSDASRLLADAALKGTQLELDVALRFQDATRAGLRVFVGEDTFTEIAYDRALNRLSVDRTRSGLVDFHPAFAEIHEAPLEIAGDSLRLRLFLDAGSLEVFADQGQVVMTELVFPESGGVSFFADHPSARVERLNAWELESAWR